VGGDQFHIREISSFDGGTLVFLVVCNGVGQNQGPRISGLTLENEAFGPHKKSGGPIGGVRGTNGNVDEPGIQECR
jgi:hypothetical protein